MATIGFLGIGKMGFEMAKRLRDAGQEMRVWNRTHDKAVAWAQEGGTACETPKLAATGVAELHIMLADDTAVEAALFGEQGALQALQSGGLVVDHSTVSVAGSKERSARITKGGWRFLQAPVLAGPAAVREGQGLMLAGGGEDVYHADERVLHQIITRHWWVGEAAETAAAFKLMANEMLVCIVEGLAEYFAIGKANGIEPKHALKLFDLFDPAGTIKLRAPRMAEGDYTPTFALAMAHKDVRLMVEAASDPATVPVLKTISEKMSRLSDRGFRDLDLSALAADIISPSQKVKTG
ncbi:MAG: NAD(P)-dependent oxidoreductase [Candidatus Eremiobacteraeota bacterium]|nr:NAD(P)-dependent oxidoreductase [Candidatus Eremiobacteraeota bacterium]